MQQEQDDKNSAIVKENEWKLLFYFTGKNIIFYDDINF